MSETIKSRCCSATARSQGSRNKRAHFFTSWVYPLMLIAVGYLIDILPLFFFPLLHKSISYWTVVALFTVAIVFKHLQDAPLGKSVLVFLLVGVGLFSGFGALYGIGLTAEFLGVSAIFGLALLAHIVVIGNMNVSLNAFSRVSFLLVKLIARAAIIAPLGFFLRYGTLSLGLTIGVSLIIAGFSAYQLGCQSSRRSSVWSEGNLQSAVALAIWSSFLFSFWQLSLAHHGVVQVGCFFFCDCWKTLGMVLFSRSCMGWVVRKTGSNQKDVFSSLSGNGINILQAWTRWLPVAVQLSALGSAGFWHLILGRQGAYVSCRVFATVCITACPCVAVLAIPLALWRVRKCANRLLVSRERLASLINYAVFENTVIVKAYYVSSVVLSGGGYYMIFGQWLNPWHAGLGMLMGQLVLFLNSHRDLSQIERSWSYSFAQKSGLIMESAKTKNLSTTCSDRIAIAENTATHVASKA